MDFVCKHLVLQGDADAAGFTINNLDLSGLNLTKDSVGLGNVDNTSDINKPISTATNVALGLKEPTIAAGTTDQYWRGDKTWQTLGALGFQGGDTTLQSLSAIGLNALGSASISARRNDYTSGPSYANASLGYYGASYASSLLGVSAANSGALAFINATYAFIYTNGLTPMLFGYNGIRRMRLMTGLNIGGDTVPGAGCLSISGDFTCAGDLAITGESTFTDDVNFSANLNGVGSIDVEGSIHADLNIECGGNLSTAGNLVSTGTLINFASIPTSDPHVAGQLWRSTNDVKISTG